MPKSNGGEPSGNLLIRSLPDGERALIEPELERVPLEFKQVLEQSDRQLSHMWFPCTGVASIVSQMADGGVVEVATIGREGVVGLAEILGADRLAQTTFVQVVGEADRIPVARFREMSGQLPILGRTLLRYAAALVTQISQGSACNRLHPVEARCARWLLMTHDRVSGDRFRLTHEFLAAMLGVTRPSVTIAAGILQNAGLITYARGQVDILDRKRLEAAACECYAIITDEFRHLVGPGRTT